MDFPIWQCGAENPNKPGLSNLIWAQYMLDNYKTVAEALKSLDQYQILPTELRGRTWPIHLSLEDATGDSVIIEYIDGKAVDSWPTRWITLSDLTNKVYYFSSTTAPNIIWVDFKNLDFSKNAKVLMVDPKRVELIGEISKELK
jgi:penicillin V acylase-like amidase (Ntn superfamily)